MLHALPSPWARGVVTLVTSPADSASFHRRSTSSSTPVRTWQQILVTGSALCFLLPITGLLLWPPVLMTPVRLRLPRPPYAEKLQRLLLTPQREMTVELIVHMDNGEVEVFQGYRVQHNNR